ncbi:hypothetical protein K450DRAFT_273625 [Umbelopsis ramanniana AG]|uniref:Uncharacterized protein n=1 Tax=Umbelopsis ramanniana AG TaxID=1314678 RepID=A0AAD5E799_UMBRA|nr:uncharacterized protein K450DRAFT_273625 [Umbelopsis ramanniana AG]KAI8577640.1 hypothetical protein K450DRAFT_273625 [Umbelopsis ramanniana AG]
MRQKRKAYGGKLLSYSFGSLVAVDYLTKRPLTPPAPSIDCRTTINLLFNEPVCRGRNVAILADGWRIELHFWVCQGLSSDDSVQAHHNDRLSTLVEQVVRTHIPDPSANPR